MKSLISYLYAMSDYNSVNNRSDRYICLLDTEPSPEDSLRQISVIICKEDGKTLKVIDSLNHYITDENVEIVREATIDFFKKYPNCIMVGNSVHYDITWVVKFVFGLKSSDSLLSATMNPTILAKFRSLVDKYNDVYHCKNSLMKSQLKCWVDANTNKCVECLSTLDCKCRALKDFLYGNDYVFVDTANDTSFKAFHEEICSRIPSRSLDTLKTYFKIPSSVIIAMASKIFKMELTSDLKLHDAMFDTVLMYYILEIFKMSLRGKQEYSEYRSQLLNPMLESFKNELKIHKSTLILDVDFRASSPMLSVLSVKYLYGKMHILDAIHLTDLYNRDRNEVYKKFSAFINKHSDKLILAHNPTMKIAQLFSYFYCNSVVVDMKHLLTQNNLETLREVTRSHYGEQLEYSTVQDASLEAFRKYVIEIVVGTTNVLPLNYILDKLYYDSQLSIPPSQVELTNVLSPLGLSDISDENLKILKSRELYRGNTLNNVLILILIIITQINKITFEELSSNLLKYIET